ncbi:MAG: LlaJI family restriction endonuclease [Methanosphaera sp.]|nr:LlaJI family restriction endonuclease [Methanosphaera sp.]
MLNNQEKTYIKELPIFKELKKYSEKELKQVIGDNDTLLKELQKYDYIRYDNEKEQYNIKFVGLILTENLIIKCIPKYIPEDIPEEQKEKEFKETMKIIRKYKKQKEDFNHENIQTGEKVSNKLTLMLYFIEDYYENGIYTNYQTIHETNGNGEINWDKTINNHNPIHKKKNNKPYYTELETRYNQNNTNDYFRQLHEYIITESSQTLTKTGLLQIFNITPTEISDKQYNDFGEKKEILEKIEKELNTEYNTHKRKLLKYMHHYISNKKNYTNNKTITAYGTSTYHVIWEEICSKVLNNKIRQEITELSLPNKKQQKNTKSLIEIIEKPKWNFKDQTTIETDRLIPDIITIQDDTFIILDAKYYDITFEKNELKGQPGLESITKQYLYEQAYKEFIKKAGFTKVKNAFLFPTYEKETKNKGTVKLNFLTRIPLEEIQIIMLPVSTMNKLYLQNKHMKTRELRLY